MNDASSLFAPVERRGLMLILSSPSGAGKTTIARLLLERHAPNLIMSISTTTRARRPSELEGRDYIFIDRVKFDRMARAGDFLEYAKVFDHCYGTPRAAVEEALADGRDVLFDIDWQGTQQLMRTARQDLVTVFVLPPSMTELERRLRSRAQDSDDIIAKRMAKAHDEMSHWSEYDYVVVNRDVQASLASVSAILSAERARRERQIGLDKFISQLK